MVVRNLTMLAVGDLFLSKPESDFALVAPFLKSGDVVIGQGETPYTTRPVSSSTDKISGHDPNTMSSLNRAGFNVISLAGNHLREAGTPGVEDTINWLRNHDIAVAGAGMNINEARRPAIIKRNGTRFGFLDYNCVGPTETWATSDKAGCAYVEIITHYNLATATPGGLPTIYTFIERDSQNAMVDDIKKLRPICDILVVVLHKGIGHAPAKLAMYEQPLSYTAIDAGADLILAHHAHLLRGVEQYKGKFIFHGLGHFIMSMPPRTEEEKQRIHSQKYLQQRLEQFGYIPDPKDSTYPFHPESKNTIIAKCIIDNGKISRVSYIPCLINDQQQPEILKNDKRGQQVFEYTLLDYPLNQSVLQSHSHVNPNISLANSMEERS